MPGEFGRLLKPKSQQIKLASDRLLVMSCDFNRPFIKRKDFGKYSAIDKTIARRFGSVVLAAELSNKEYKIRFGKMHNEVRMRPPPSSERIFPGYLVVRRLGTPHEYETWIPDHGFEESYDRCP